MSESEKNLLTDAVVNFDGWVVPSAEGVVAPYEHENDIAETRRFFGKLLTLSDDEAPQQAQPA